MKRAAGWIAAVASMLVAGPILAQPPAGAPPGGPGPDFNAIVKPVLMSRCVICHGPQAQRAGLRLDNREAAMKGGISGPAIVPGNSGASKLFQMVATKKMPLDDELSVLELGALKAWIDSGARWPEGRALPQFTADLRVDQFRLALRNGDRTAIDKALADPGLVKARGPDGSTLLHHVAVFGDAAHAKALLDKGAEINAVNLSGATALIAGVRNDALAQVLIERGADVNAVTENGVTPLIAAAGRTSGAGVLRLLIARGAKATPPQSAALANAAGITINLDTLKVLVPALIPANGQPATILAANVTTARCYACLDYLIAQGAKGVTLKDALVGAANNADAALVKRLLDLGATLDGRGNQDATALMAATMSDIEPAEKVRLLLAAGADVNTPDAHGRTPLTFARAVHPELAPTLIAKGAK